MYPISLHVTVILLTQQTNIFKKRTKNITFSHK